LHLKAELVMRGSKAGSRNCVAVAFVARRVDVWEAAKLTEDVLRLVEVFELVESVKLFELVKLTEPFRLVELVELSRLVELMALIALVKLMGPEELFAAL
jgi:hypothetical protein